MKLLLALLSSFVVSGVGYCVFILLAPWIWRHNIPYDPRNVTRMMLGAIQQDGWEIYALYLLMFANIVGTLLLARCYPRVKKAVSPGVLWALLIFAAAAYCRFLSFIPPLNSLQSTPLASVASQSAAIVLVCSAVIAVLLLLQKFSEGVVLAASALLLLPVCFIAKEAINQVDYYYVFAPALRLLKGMPPSEIYFQYDLLLSLIAAGWHRLGLDMNSFQLIGMSGYYLAILALFAFSRRLFLRRELSLFLLLALVLGRLYTSPWDVNQCIQVTPFRLDLWLLLVLVVYRFGPYHWLAGLTCGLLVILHKNFGTIYIVAYLQLLLTLWGVQRLNDDKDESLFPSILSHGRRCLLPLGIIVACAATSHLLFWNRQYGNYAAYYQKIGIGFLKIAETSFYWYIAPLFAMVVLLLLSMRNRLPTQYVQTGFLLTYCALGNSIYFFGRSHEHNLINICLVLIFLFFFMLDLIARYLQGEGSSPASLRRHAATACAAAVIVGISLCYSQHITSKAAMQLRNAASRTFLVGYDPDSDLSGFRDHLERIRTMTAHSDKVYFIEEKDWLYCYYGGYNPVGYCSPFATWIFKDEQRRFLQNLLESGYYLVCRDDLKYVMKDLKYDRKQELALDVVVWKEARGAAPTPL